mmetsp:Transcript_25976/g.53143  ORF Transcript_25976/g.53143 Transcript_25976/m.53143 type:complete len:302 (-) Transcript_25976:247-1152(-)
MDFNCSFAWSIILAYCVGWFLISSKIHTNVAPMKLANLMIGVSIICSVPFLAHTLFGQKSWTGLDLTPQEAERIEGSPGHVHLVYCWLLLSVFQAVTFKRLQSVHNVVGKVTMGVCAFALCEISLNAIFVFLPDKPKLLAQAVLGKDDVTVKEILEFTNVFFIGLTLPVGVGAHLFFGASHVLSAAHKNMRLHVHHMLCVMTMMLGPAYTRFVCKALFHELSGTGCKEHGDPKDAIRVQNSSFFFAYFFNSALLHTHYMALSATLKKDKSVEIMRRFWFLYGAYGAVAACWLGVDFYPNCL